MARPTKQGIDYFALDVQFDDKIELYLIEKEATGLAVMVTLWQLIYQNEGYYINNSGDLHLLIKRRINVDTNEVNECINAMLARGIFDKRLHDEYGILTSRAIQKRYFDAAKRKKEISVIREFVVIPVNSYNNIVNVDNNAVNVCNNATKEEVDVEVKEKEKERTGGKPPRAVYSNDFETFWKMYPKKAGKAAAYRQWVKARDRPGIERMLNAISARKSAEQYARDNSLFYPEWPDPERWIKNERWNDDPASLTGGKRNGAGGKSITGHESPEVESIRQYLRSRQPAAGAASAGAPQKNAGPDHEGTHDDG